MNVERPVSQPSDRLVGQRVVPLTVWKLAPHSSAPYSNLIRLHRNEEARVPLRLFVDVRKFQAQPFATVITRRVLTLGYTIKYVLWTPMHQPNQFSFTVHRATNFRSHKLEGRNWDIWWCRAPNTAIKH